jgi:hypothetical protein
MVRRRSTPRSLAPTSVIRTRATIASRTSRTVCGLGNAASRADPARGSRKLPPAPANPCNVGVESPCCGWESPPIPAQPGSATTGLVTPEVAGSSPVAPAKNILQIGIFVAWLGANDRRLSACPALIPRQVEKDPFAGVFAASKQERTAVIPHDSHPDGPKRPKWAKTVAWFLSRKRLFARPSTSPATAGAETMKCLVAASRRRPHVPGAPSFPERRHQHACGCG